MLDDGPEESTTTMDASAEEDEHKDFNNDSGGVSRGYTTHPRDRRRQRRRQRLDDGPNGVATKTDCQFSLIFRR